MCRTELGQHLCAINVPLLLGLRFSCPEIGSGSDCHILHRGFQKIFVRNCCVMHKLLLTFHVISLAEMAVFAPCSLADFLLQFIDCLVQPRSSKRWSSQLQWIGISVHCCFSVPVLLQKVAATWDTAGLIGRFSQRPAAIFLFK